MPKVRQKMKIAILSRGSQNYSTRSLYEAAENAGHTAHILDPFGFYLRIGGARSQSAPTAKCGSGNSLTYEGASVEDIDVVIPRISSSTAAYGQEVIAHFEWLGTPVMNRAQAIATARHKFRSLRILAQHGLPVPPSLTVGAAEFLDEAVAELGDYPFILKPFYGTHGSGVMLLDTQTSLTSAVDALCELHQDYIIQPFISDAGGYRHPPLQLNTGSVDIRILVVGGEVIAAMKRSAPPGEFRANIHRGASGEAVTLSENERSLAVRATAALELDIAGVDLLQTAGGPVILEVNPSPGFEELESVTGINIAAAIIGFAVDVL